jgi:hypothetical protein
MYTFILLTLVLLNIKHWYVDFVNQTMDEVHGKGIYGNWLGIRHSLKHALGTFLVIVLMGAGLVGAGVLAMIDFVLHYHIDWAKMNWGNRDITNPEFWNHLGLDQMLHHFTYLGMVYLLVS